MPRDIEEYRKEVDARDESELTVKPVCLQNNSWWDTKMSRYQHLSRLQEHRKNAAKTAAPARKFSGKRR